MTRSRRDAMDLLEEAHQAEGAPLPVLAAQMVIMSGLPLATLRALLAGKARIGEREAACLERMTGRPAKGWLRCQELHDSFLAQEAEQERRRQK